MATTTNKVTLKLLIDKKSNKVLFAEAGKDFVDFLCSILSFPLGTVIRLLTKDHMVGCLGNLYKSINDLSDTFMIQSSRTKNTILNPKSPLDFVGDTLLLKGGSDYKETRKLYTCSGSYHRACVSEVKNVECPNCENLMSYDVTFVGGQTVAGGNSSLHGGFVKGVVTYMVMDNLEVKPMSTISSITLLSHFNIQQVGALEEKVVELALDDGLDLLEASLQSKTVLTKVFLSA
ncbi:hypothetical protein LINGRAHAP2_LOCUS19444 [Linum grandiflorum]